MQLIPRPGFERKMTNHRFLIALLCIIGISLPFFVYTIIKAHSQGLLSFRSVREIIDYNSNKIKSEVANIFYFSIIGFCINVAMLCLFRYFTHLFVWFILLGSLLEMVAFSAWLWTDEYMRGWAIAFTIVSCILLILLIWLIKRVELIIPLFKESVRVIFGIPVIFLQMVLTFVAHLILFIVTIYFIGAGIVALVKENEKQFFYNFTFTIVLYVFMWFGEIIEGCQHMVISGAVSEYFFTRDKSTISMICLWYRSFYNLVRFHLGSVIFGTLVIINVRIIRRFIRFIIRNFCPCLNHLERFMKFLTNNSYYVVAMHGEPLLKSSRRAGQLLGANSLSVIARKYIGNFILFMIKLQICIMIIFIGVRFEDDTKPELLPELYQFIAIFVSVIITYLIAHCIFDVFHITIDTLFLCFCEDFLMNDGETSPYYMSLNFKQYIEAAKKRTKTKDLR